MVESKMIDDSLSIASEIVEVEALLESIPAGNLIERKSLQARLEHLKSVLAAIRSEQDSSHAIRSVDHAECVQS
jgi:hypothetical protein